MSDFHFHFLRKSNASRKKKKINHPEFYYLEKKKREREGYNDVYFVALSRSVKSDSFVTPWTVARQVPLSLGFPRIFPRILE